MTTYRFFSLIIVWMAVSCGHTGNGKLEIYHLEPDDMIIREDNSNERYTIERIDFFAIKNFDVNNELHKLQVDSFVLNYIRNDKFLEKNENANWILEFYQYGKDINERTIHETGTDYAIHTLFSSKRRLVFYSFSTKKGYIETLHWKDGEKIGSFGNKRKLIQEYFENKGF